MARYLLAAEADKIQDLIFRSSRLREVVGASQLLTRFCKMVPDSLIDAETEIIISDGGSFRILFKNENTAKIFGEYLCEIYRLATGGTLTVAEPVKIPNLLMTISLPQANWLKKISGKPSAKIKVGVQ